MLTQERLQELEQIAVQIREDIIQMLLAAGSGHSAGPLGLADIFTALYFEVLNLTPETLTDPSRDRFVLSAGHLCPVWYATLIKRGYLRADELLTLRKLGSRLHGHPWNLATPAVETSSGPLGQGLSQAIGMALAGQLDAQKYWVYALLSDAEHQEGQLWEAIMFAGNRGISNLTALVDRNNIQIDGFTEDVMPLEPLAAKYEAFNWHVLEVDGHNIEQIIDACNEAKAIFNKPVVILAHTIPGKGVAFMERDYHWHGIPPSSDQARDALRALRTLEGKIVAEHD